MSWVPSEDMNLRGAGFAQRPRPDIPALADAQVRRQPKPQELAVFGAECQRMWQWKGNVAVVGQ